MVCFMFAAAAMISELFRPILSQLFYTIYVIQRIFCNNLPLPILYIFLTQVPLLQFL